LKTDQQKEDTFENRRLSDGRRVPFVIRAWWLREFEEIKEVDWNNDVIGSLLWSSYSDPICDLGGVGDLEDL
jgi:hypothetical protein